MSPTHVTVAGGGLAGLTAALRLAERDCQVTLYEEKSMLGGNLASRTLRQGAVIDIYPHMYQGWYLNFWRLMNDIGVDRSKSFTRFDSFYQMRRRGESPHLAKLTDVFSAGHLLENLRSGVAPPADTFVSGYASIDLLAEQLNPTMRLENMSLTGFLNTRTYITNAAIEAYEAFIMRVWAIPGYLISAADCHTYLTYCYGEADQGTWLAGGPAADTVIDPLRRALEKAGVQIVLNTRIEEVVCRGERVSTIKLERTRFDPRTEAWVGTGECWDEKVENLLLAVPATTLSHLVRSGKAGGRIVDAEKRLAELSRLSSQRVPMLNLCLKRKLADIPAEPVGLLGSKLLLAFTDTSQVWNAPEFAGHTVLAVSCSEPYALGGAHPPEDGYTIMVELADYLDFEPGERWMDSADVDWGLTRYHSNSDAQLTLNAIGTDAWRPGPLCEGLENLYFAGDFCEHPFGITTLEAAVATGLAAAGELVKRRGGEEIVVEQPRTLPAELFLLMRYAWLPGAFAAKAWSMIGEFSGETPPAATDGGSLLRYLLTPGLPPRYRRSGS